MPFLSGIKGLATGVSAGLEEREKEKRTQRELAYRGLLQKELKQTPGALPPETAAYQTMQTQLAPQQLEIQKQQEGRLQKQQAETALNSAYTRAKSVTNAETGGPLEGREAEYYSAMAGIMQYTKAFKPGGQLSDTEGKSPEENNFLKASRKFATNPSPKAWKDVVSAVSMFPKGQPEKGTPTFGQQQKIESVRAGLKRGEVTIGRQFGEPATYPITSLDEAYRAIGDAGLNPSLFQEELKGYESVMVKDKKGQTGTIPRNQLENALTQGYTEVKTLK